MTLYFRTVILISDILYIKLDFKSEGMSDKGAKSEELLQERKKGR